jgi:radical SAM superfamily enzyme YgiQ (UPF0313 family)
MGSFIIGLDVDQPGIGKRIASVAGHYGLDNLNVLFLTPLPGTRLWDQMKSQDRLALNAFPEDWKYYTLTFPVARYKHFSLDGILQEMMSCNRTFYSLPRILRRVVGNLWRRRKPLISLVSNLSYWNNVRFDCKAYADFKRQRGSGLAPNEAKGGPKKRIESKGLPGRIVVVETVGETPGPQIAAEVRKNFLK